jgi:hypothetical protein
VPRDRFQVRGGAGNRGHIELSRNETFGRIDPS